jgi:hypothetical protein
MADHAAAIARFQPCSETNARQLETLLGQDAEVSVAIFELVGGTPSKGTLGGGAPAMKKSVVSSSGTNAMTFATDRNLRDVFARILVRRSIQAGDFSDLRRILGLSTL